MANIIQALCLIAPPDGYGVFIPQWEVEVSPGGETLNLSGTVEEVHSQLLQLNHDWDTQYLEHKLTKRTDFSRSKYFCGRRWPRTGAGPIYDGINYLRRVPGRPANDAGPGNCGRVSCSYDAAIWWCNDVRYSNCDDIIDLFKLTCLGSKPQDP